MCYIAIYLTFTCVINPTIWCNSFLLVNYLFKKLKIRKKYYTLTHVFVISDTLHFFMWIDLSLCLALSSFSMKELLHHFMVVQICYRYIFIDFLVSFLCGAYKNVFILFPILKAIFFLNVGSCLTIIYLSIHSSISIHLSSIYLSIHLYLSIYHLSILLSALKSCYSVISYIAFSYQGSKVLLTLFLCKFVSLLLRFSLCFFFPAI